MESNGTKLVNRIDRKTTSKDGTKLVNRISILLFFILHFISYLKPASVYLRRLAGYSSIAWQAMHTSYIIRLDINYI